jgi:hypothetical protein
MALSPILTGSSQELKAGELHEHFTLGHQPHNTMAMKVEGGRMVPLSRDVVARRDWLRNREFRLQEALKSGKVDEALQWISEIQGSAKPGDVNPTKIEAVVKALRESKSAIAMAQNSAQRIVTQ